MKSIIERVHYTEFRNDEFPVYYSQILGICDKHNPTVLHLEKSYGELSSFREPFKSVTVFIRQHEKLAHAGKLDVERDTVATNLVKLVKSFRSIAAPEQLVHIELIDALLEKHKIKTVAASSRAAETERLLIFEADVKAGGEQLQNAFAEFKLTSYVDRLIAANKEYDALFREYITDKSEEQRINIATLRKAAGKALTQFFDAVQYSAYIYENRDYKPLINELNLLNRYYIQQLKSRATRRKNGQTTDAEPSIAPMPDTETADAS